jgi:hypothetical protein
MTRTEEARMSQMAHLNALEKKGIIVKCPNPNGSKLTPFYRCVCCQTQPCSKWHITDHVNNSTHPKKQRAFEMNPPKKITPQDREVREKNDKTIDDLKCKLNLAEIRGDDLQKRVNLLEEQVNPDLLKENSELKEKIDEYEKMIVILNQKLLLPK